MHCNPEEINYKPGKLLRFWRKLGWLFTVYLKPRHEATVCTANGILSFDSSDRKTGRSIYVERQFEYDMMQDTIGFLHSIGALNMPSGSGTVLDVGGYIGMSSTAFMISGLFERAIAFEPNPGSYHFLKKNVIQNNLEDRIAIHNIALSDEKGSLVFELSHDNFGDHRIRSSESTDSDDFNESNRETITINADTLDNLVNNSTIGKIEDISLVWMDVQGHEGRFIKGAFNFLNQHPYIPVVMEFWPYAMNRSGMKRDDFLDLIGKLFNTFYFMDEKNFIRHPIDDLKNYYLEFESGENASIGGSIILLNET